MVDMMATSKVGSHLIEFNSKYKIKVLKAGKQIIKNHSKSKD
jgi:hypothetical protein